MAAIEGASLTGVTSIVTVTGLLVCPAASVTRATTVNIPLKFGAGRTVAPSLPTVKSPSASCGVSATVRVAGSSSAALRAAGVIVSGVSSRVCKCGPGEGSAGLGFEATVIRKGASLVAPPFATVSVAA